MKILNNCERDNGFSDFHECDGDAREHVGCAEEKRYLADRETRACGHFWR